MHENLIGPLTRHEGTITISDVMHQGYRTSQIYPLTSLLPCGTPFRESLGLSHPLLQTANSGDSHQMVFSALTQLTI